MSHLFIYGASDDLLEIEGEVEEEFEVIDGRTILIQDPQGARLWVRASFCGNGPLRNVGSGWCLEVLHADPKTLWPWPVRMSDRDGTEYDPALMIECPEGTTVEEWSE